uniref:Uncharacterized protein n=1 Tax=Cricetulus griseus TaxID=10029 RepID=A0A8C2MVJ0_CRIGR
MGPARSLASFLQSISWAWETPERQSNCFIPEGTDEDTALGAGIWARAREVENREQDPGSARGKWGAGSGFRQQDMENPATVYSPLSSVPVGGPRRPGRRGKERPEPSGSLPWDTSCTALGPRRSPHLSGSLPRLPAEVYAGGDIRHPRPARPAPPRSVLALLGRGVRALALWAFAVRSGCARPGGTRALGASLGGH